MTDRPPYDGRPRVLMAEDEPIASMALRAQLEALDFEVLGPAQNGEEAVALGACFPPDFALFDVRMPRRSGLDAAHDLFAIAPTPVILLTGVGIADLPDPLPEPPVFGVLTKPVDLAALRSGFDDARDRFDRWTRASPDRQDAVRQGRARRDTLGKAVLAMEEHRPAAAATRLLERANAEGRPPEDIARDILDRIHP